MNRQRIIRVAAIVAVAGATGYVMQSQDKAQPRAAAVVQMPQLAQAAALPVVPSARVQAQPAPLAAPAAAPVALAAAKAETAALPVAAAAVPTLPAADSPPAAAAQAACSDDMALIAQPGAMLDLGLLAACRPDQRVLIRHGGLVVTGRTSSAGTLIASVPALVSPAEVTLAFADGTEVSQTVTVPDLEQFDRFGVQWMEGDAFQLHAYHAADGTEVFGDTTPRPTPDGGFLTRIGDASAPRPLLAEVYTFPAAARALSGQVELSLESAVTPATCGREVLGETLQLSAGRLTLRDLTIEMPGCEAVGEYVVLPNPVTPEKLASN